MATIHTAFIIEWDPHLCKVHVRTSRSFEEDLGGARSFCWQRAAGSGQRELYFPLSMPIFLEAKDTSSICLSTMSSDLCLSVDYKNTRHTPIKLRSMWLNHLFLDESYDCLRITKARCAGKISNEDVPNMMATTILTIHTVSTTTLRCQVLRLLGIRNSRTLQKENTRVASNGADIS